MRYFDFLFNNDLLKVLAICIVLDTIFGILRAIKQRKINSNIGIDRNNKKSRYAYICNLFWFNRYYSRT